MGKKFQKSWFMSWLKIFDFQNDVSVCKSSGRLLKIFAPSNEVLQPFCPKFRNDYPFIACVSIDVVAVACE